MWIWICSISGTWWNRNILVYFQLILSNRNLSIFHIRLVIIQHVRCQISLMFGLNFQVKIHPRLTLIVGLSYMYASGPYQWATTPRGCTTFSYLPFWKYFLWLSQHASLLGSMIQDIKGKFLWCGNLQHVTSSNVTILLNCQCFDFLD